MIDVRYDQNNPQKKVVATTQLGIVQSNPNQHYIHVGFSAGGYPATYVANNTPNQTTGLVLIDPNLESADDTLTVTIDPAKLFMALPGIPQNSQPPTFYFAIDGSDPNLIHTQLSVNNEVNEAIFNFIITLINK